MILLFKSLIYASFISQLFGTSQSPQIEPEGNSCISVKGISLFIISNALSKPGELIILCKGDSSLIKTIALFTALSRFFLCGIILFSRLNYMNYFAT